MSQRQRRKLFRLIPVKVYGGGKTLFLYRRKIDVKLGIKMEQDICGIFFRGKGRIKA